MWVKKKENKKKSSAPNWTNRDVEKKTNRFHPSLWKHLAAKKRKKKSQKPPRVKAFLVIQLYLFLSVTIGPFFLFSPMRVSLLSQNLERNSTAS